MDVRTAAANRPLSDASTRDESLRGRTRQRKDVIALGSDDQRKDEFIAMLAHELRGPLGPIRMAAAILSQPHVAAAIADKARTIIERQIDDMTRLIDDLLDVARITQGKMHLDFVRADLTEVMHRSLDVVQHALSDRAQQLSVSLPSEACYVRGDTRRLQQVFGNLLTNASKFSKRAGRIWLSVDSGSSRERGSEVSVHIRDEGIGIAPNRLEHIFELFEQAGESPHRTRGLGVGLALVRQIVELHGGSVRAQSEGTDHGSEFTVVLPLLEASPIPAPDYARSI